MRTSNYIFIFLSAFTFLSVCNKSVDDSKIMFGVKVGLVNNSKLLDFSVFRMRNGLIVGSKNVNPRELMMIGTGKWPLPGSYKPNNYFNDKNLKIVKAIDERTLDEFPYCRAFDSLWKIRFSEHPFSKKKLMGWSNGNFKPSLKQQEYIYNTYGVRNFEMDYFMDTSFFKIMRDVQDSSWIANYRAL